MLLRSMVTRSSVCLRRLARGRRARQVGFGRFLANRKVTVDRLIEGWSDRTAAAVKGRHVLALQDTSEINFRTTPKRRRGLGEIGKGSGRGVLLHAMLALDAKTAGCLGLVGGRIWTRRGRVKVAHQKRRTENKESYRWITTAEQGKAVLAAAAQVTVIADRESVSARYVSRLLPLAFLAPDILEAILEGRHPADLSTARLTNRLDLPPDWASQRELIGA